MSCRVQTQTTTDAPHQNTRESIDTGNILLAEAKELRDRGAMLARSRDELDMLSAEAFHQAGVKQNEAEKILIGKFSYRVR